MTSFVLVEKVARVDFPLKVHAQSSLCLTVFDCNYLNYLVLHFTNICMLQCLGAVKTDMEILEVLGSRCFSKCVPLLSTLKYETLKNLQIELFVVAVKLN